MSFPRTDKHMDLLVTESFTGAEKKERKSFELQERGTALKNKRDRWQYVKFYANGKKNQLIKID